MIIKDLFILRDDTDANSSGGTSDAGASSSSDSTSNQTDVNQGGDSSASQQSDQGKTEKTLENIVQDVFKKSQSSSDEGKADSGIQKLNATEEENKGAESGKKEEESQDSEEGKEGEEGEGKQEELEAGKPVPYERFTEVNTKAKEFEGKVKELEPLAQAQRGVAEHCMQHEITPEQFRDWMDIAALANVDPEQAIVKLKPIMDRLQGFTGDKLPSDLQQAVDNGDISLDYAKRLVRAESKTKLGERQVQKTQEQMMAEKQQQFAQSMRQSVSSWIDSKKGSDPDFAPKTDAKAPHGKFELFMNEFAAQAKARMSEIKSADDLIKVAEEAYSTINATLKGFQPKITTQSKLNSNRSSSSTKPVVKTVDEAIAQAAKKHGIVMAVN